LDKNTNADLWNSLSLDLIGIQIDGRLVFINAAGARLLGADSPEQLIGKPIMDLIHPDCQGIAVQTVQETSQEETAVLSKEKWIRMDGRVIDLEIAAIPLIYQDKPAVQFIARDITRCTQAKRRS
jgi:PAS domain S-box-containing protein